MRETVIKMKSFLFIALFALLASVSSLRRKHPDGYDGKIVGGEPIDISEVPWQVSLQINKFHLCGGSIISKNWVVTAAHCTDGLKSQKLYIRAGSTDRTVGGQVINISKIHQNPNFNGDNIDYDISLLELSTTLTFNENVATVNLPPANYSWEAGTESLVTGWGETKDGSSPDNLLGVKIDIISQEACRSAYAGKEDVTDRMLCAGVKKGGKDACHGDSGGPLVINKTLAGVVSWGYGCGRPEYPGVYSNVPALRSYIKEVTGI